MRSAGRGKPYDLRQSRIKDLPFGHRPLEVVWRKRERRIVLRVAGKSVA